MGGAGTVKTELFVYDRCGVNEAHKAEKFTHLKLERKQFNISAKVFQNSTEDSKNLNQPLTPFSEKLKLRQRNKNKLETKQVEKKRAAKLNFKNHSSEK